jgi:hypothetical protein
MGIFYIFNFLKIAQLWSFIEALKVCSKNLNWLLRALICLLHESTSKILQEALLEFTTFQNSQNSSPYDISVTPFKTKWVYVPDGMFHEILIFVLTLALHSSGKGGSLGKPKTFLEHTTKTLMWREIHYYWKYPDASSLKMKIDVTWLRSRRFWPKVSSLSASNFGPKWPVSSSFPL